MHYIYTLENAAGSPFYVGRTTDPFRTSRRAKRDHGPETGLIVVEEAKLEKMADAAKCDWLFELQVLGFDMINKDIAKPEDYQMPVYYLDPFIHEHGHDTHKVAEALGLGFSTWLKYRKSPGLMSIDEAVNLCVALNANFNTFLFMYAGGYHTDRRQIKHLKEQTDGSGQN